MKMFTKLKTHTKQPNTHTFRHRPCSHCHEY